MRTAFLLVALVAAAFVSAQNCANDGCGNDGGGCCSQYGYCGTTADYCDRNNGCQSGCWGDNNGGGDNNNYGTIDDGDRAGQDLPNMPVQASSAQDCQKQCHDNSACVAFAYDSCGNVNCWLKSGSPGKVDSSCRKSGQITGRDNGGNNGGNGGNNGTLTWKNVIYIMQAVDWNNNGKSLNVPGHSPVSSGYNVINLAFYDSVNGAGEMAQTWAQLSSGDRNSYLDAYHKAGMKVLVSLFGGADGNPSRLNPKDFANQVVGWVKQNKLDGVDVDYEDENSFGQGRGAQWVISLTKTLRAGLPRPYLITHAPQGPHFSYGTFQDNAYITINQQAGDLIDWYNIQYYNNGGYDNCNDLMFNRNGYGDKSSVMEIHQQLNIPTSKLVVGKPVGTKSRNDADNGFMDINTLVGCIQQAKGKGYSNGGIMGWELFYDQNGNWGNTAPNAWK